MSHRSVFANFLRVSCWVADLLLIVLAVYLAIHNRDNLTVSIALALGLSVLLGGLLPLAVYGLDYLFARNERLMEEARGPENLRAAMARLDKLVHRVEAAAEGATKSTLVARQVPDRIEDKLGALDALAARLQPESLEKLAAEVAALGQRLDERVSGPTVETAETGESEALEDDWVDEPTDLEAVFLPGEEESVEPRPPFGEEVVMDDPLDAEIAVEKKAAAETGKPTPPEVPAREPNEKPTPPEVPAREPKEKEPKKEPAKRKAAKTAKKKAAAEDESSLFSPDELLSADGLETDRGLLVVKAMVGIANTLYARGDAPLNWEQGVALVPSGIGEWRLELKELREPLQCELRINDEVSALGAPVRIEPGRRQIVTPRFPPL